MVTEEDDFYQGQRRNRWSRMTAEEWQRRAVGNLAFFSISNIGSRWGNYSRGEALHNNSREVLVGITTLPETVEFSDFNYIGK